MATDRSYLLYYLVLPLTPIQILHIVSTMDLLSSYDDESSRSNMTSADQAAAQNTESPADDLQSEWESFEKMIDNPSPTNTSAASSVSKMQHSDSIKNNQSNESKMAGHSVEQDDDEEDESHLPPGVRKKNRCHNSSSSSSEDEETDMKQKGHSNSDSSSSDSDDSDTSEKRSKATAPQADKKESKESDKPEAKVDTSKGSTEKGSRSKSRSKSRSRSPRKHRRSSDRSRHSRSRSRDRHRRKEKKHRSHRSRSHDRRRSKDRDRHRHRDRKRSRSHSRSKRDKRRDDSRDRGHKDRGRGRRDRSSSPSAAKVIRFGDKVIKAGASFGRPPPSKPLTFKEKMRQQFIKAMEEGGDVTKALTTKDGTLMCTQTAGIQQPPAPKKPPVPLMANLVTSTAGLAAATITASEAAMQSMLALQKETTEKTGVEIPKYYNPAAINPMKYAEQVQKRKLLWSKTKEKEVNSQWHATSLSSEHDDKSKEKFRKLMGIKGESGAAAGCESVEKSSEEQDNKQRELFDKLDKEYQYARMATHTHRGIGLGFGSTSYQPGQ